MQSAYHSSVILNDACQGNMAEIFSSSNVLSVTLNLTVTTAPGKRTIRFFWSNNRLEEGGRNVSLSGSVPRGTP